MTNVYIFSKLILTLLILSHIFVQLCATLNWPFFIKYQMSQNFYTNFKICLRSIKIQIFQRQERLLCSFYSVTSSSHKLEHSLLKIKYFGINYESSWTVINSLTLNIFSRTTLSFNNPSMKITPK